MAELTVHSVYPESPGVDLGKRFLEHVRTTGTPETFSTISTARPPKTGQLVVLAYPVDINRDRRANKDMAPCPICCPTDPKWLSRGSLIWCEDTQAIYCVGPKCSTTGWAAARLTAAQNAFLQVDREKKAAIDLTSAVALVEARLAWIDAALPAVQHVDQLHSGLAKEQGAVRNALRRATKGSPDLQVDVGGRFQPVGPVNGTGFLTSSWQEGKRLEEARRKLLSLRADVGSESAADWATGLAPTIRKAKLKTANATAEALAVTSRKVGEAAAFLSDQTFRTLVAWSRAGAAPTGCSISQTEGAIEIRGEGYPWRARAGEVKPLPPVPQ